MLPREFSLRIFGIALTIVTVIETANSNFRTNQINIEQRTQGNITIDIASNDCWRVERRKKSHEDGFSEISYFLENRCGDEPSYRDWEELVYKLNTFYFH
jgi:hypothetical protein